MKTGDIYYGEFSLTNYGLIRAEEVTLHPPEGTPNFQVEYLADLPDTIEAKERIYVPYRVLCLSSPGQERERWRLRMQCNLYRHRLYLQVF